MTEVAPASTAASNPSAKGKKASDATAEPLVSGSFKFRRFGGVFGFTRGDARGIDPAHLSRSDTDGGAVLRINNRVRFHMFGDGKGKQKIAHLGFARLALGHAFKRSGIEHFIIARLHEIAAGNGFDDCAGTLRGRHFAREQNAQIFLRRQNRARLIIAIGRDDHFGKQIGNRFRGLAIQRPVAGDDAAERADGIASECPLIGCQQIGAERHAAGIGMFDNGDGGADR